MVKPARENPWRLTFLVFLFGASIYAALLYFDPSVLAPFPFLSIGIAEANVAPGGWKIYSSHALGVSLDYPGTFSVSTGSVRTPLSSRAAAPSSAFFAVPDSYAPGTTLSTPDSGMSVETLPAATPCSGDAFLDESIDTGSMSDHGVAYSVAKSAGSTLTDSYQETVYALEGSNPCTAIRYVIHTKNVHASASAGLKPFDTGTLLSQFDAMRRSVVLTR